MTKLKDALRHCLDRGFGDRAAIRYALAHGRPYRGMNGIEHGKPNECFTNASRLARLGKGLYVEGFMVGHQHLEQALREETEAECLSALEHWIVHHAWITTDGKNAVEVTHQDDPRNYLYWGSQFGRLCLTRFISRTGGEPPIICGSDWDGYLCIARRRREPDGQAK